MRLIDADRLMKVIESVPFPNDLTVGAVRTAVDLAPTADVAEVPQWIPVSSGELPEYGTPCLVTFRNDKINRNIVRVSYCYVQKEGFWSDRPFEYKAVAYMELPEPWEGGAE